MSKRKRARSKQVRKPRASEIRVDFGRPQVISGIHEADGGTLTFFGEQGEVVKPVRIEVGSVYTRPTKTPKVLTREPGEPGSIQLDLNQALLRFAFVIAVDTNTVVIDENGVSISVAVLIRDIEIAGQRWSAKLVPQDAFEFHDAAMPPERIGWWDAIRRFTAHPDVRGPIALVVDSELGAIAAINAREQPILDGFYLPEGVQLVYGCGDRGTQEFVSNAAIADCDRVASRLLDRVRKESPSGAYLQAVDAPYARYRYWRAPTGSPRAQA